MKLLFERTTEKFRLAAKLSPDKLKLFVDAAPAGTGGAVTRQELIELFEAVFNPERLDLGVIDDIAKRLSAGEAVTERRVARGTAAEAGRDGKLVLLVKKFTGTGEVKVDEKGRADFRALHLFDNIATGQAVGRIYLPKPGVPGTDVLGNAISAPNGKPAKISVDKSLTVEDVPNEPYQVVKAAANGFLMEDGGKLSLRTELVIAEDLDLHWGSIDFIGSVRITGDVMPGLSVRARGNIEVGGGMSEAQLAAEGEIAVKGACVGGRSGRIVSGGAFTGLALREIEVEARGDINILQESFDARLRTCRRVVAPKAEIVGGECIVVEGLEAKAIGSERGAKTLVVLASDVEATSEFVRLKNEIATHERALTLLEMHLGPYAQKPDRVVLLNEPLRSRMQALIEKRSSIERSKLALLAERAAKLEAAAVHPQIRINALQRLYAGTEIRAGELVFRPKETLDGPITVELDREKNELRPVPYTSLDEPMREKDDGNKGSEGT